MRRKGTGSCATDRLVRAEGARTDGVVLRRRGVVILQVDRVWRMGQLTQSAVVKEPGAKLAKVDKFSAHGLRVDGANRKWTDSHIDMRGHKGLAARVMSQKDQGELGWSQEAEGGTRAHIPARIISGLVILERSTAGSATAQHQATDQSIASSQERELMDRFNSIGVARPGLRERGVVCATWTVAIGHES